MKTKRWVAGAHRHRFNWLGWLGNRTIPEGENRDAAWCVCGALKITGYKHGPMKTIPGTNDTYRSSIELPVRIKLPKTSA